MMFFNLCDINSMIWNVILIINTGKCPDIFCPTLAVKYICKWVEFDILDSLLYISIWWTWLALGHTIIPLSLTLKAPRITVLCINHFASRNLYDGLQKKPPPLLQCKLLNLFILQVNVQQRFQKLTDILSEHYTEEDRQIVACPRIEQINLLLSTSTKT